MATIADAMSDFLTEKTKPKKERRPTLSPMEQLDLLHEFYNRYVVGHPVVEPPADVLYRPGDLITPHVSSFYRSAGEPHIVLEVIPVMRNWEAEPSSPNYGARADIRVACVLPNGDHHSVMPYSVEAWHFVKWDASSTKAD